MEPKIGTNKDTRNRTATGQSEERAPLTRLAKTHQDYWKAKLKRRSYVGRDGVRVQIPEWQVRMFHLCREMWFNLETANQALASGKARDIYVSLVSLGWDATLAKFKPDPLLKAEVCTLGEFLADVSKRSHLKPKTIRSYAVKLRKIVGDVANVERGLKGKERLRKFNHVGDGRAKWLATVDGQRLDVLSPQVVNAWRNRYVAKAGSDPLKRKSAERSAASILRCSRALFSADVVESLRVKLPDNPFAGVKLKDPGPQRYHSEVNPELLWAAAGRELKAECREQYLSLFLCLWAGLRRKEADLLMWEQIDFDTGCIHIRRTRFFEPKTEEAQRTIDLAPEVAALLLSLKAGSRSEFVLAGSDPNPAATYAYYRCNHTWRELNAWLKRKGIRATKAIHTLRKESGSLIASEFGIEAAREHLGHRQISTTSAHYVAKKRRIEVNLVVGKSGQLQALNAAV